jgi:hypothetical protein
MKFVLLLVAGFGVSVIAVKLAVEFVGGQNRSASSCAAAAALALFVQVPFTILLGSVIGPMVALIIAGSIYKAFLGTTFAKGVAIALSQTILTLVVISVLGAAFFGGSTGIVPGAGL